MTHVEPRTDAKQTCGASVGSKVDALACVWFR